MGIRAHGKAIQATTCEDFLLQTFSDIQEHRPWIIVPSRKIIGTIPPLTVYKPPVRKEGVVIGAIQSYSSRALIVKHDYIGQPIPPDWSDFDQKQFEQRMRVDSFLPSKSSREEERQLEEIVSHMQYYMDQ